MTSSKELLNKIASLRTRLDRMQTGSGPAAGALPATRPPHFPAAASPPRLTHHAARLLKDARAELSELRELGEHPLLADDAVCSKLQREAAGILDLILQTLLTVPESAATQLRHCEGLAAALGYVREITQKLRSMMAKRCDDDAQIERLAELLRRLVQGRPVGLAELLPIAQEIADEAIRGTPLRLGAAPRSNVARLAAQQGLAVARVQAWALRGDVRQRLAESLVPALIHDAGMLAVPEDVVFHEGPLDDGERHLLEQHPYVSREAALRVYPGGGTPVDAVADHHERLDGSGYPNGKTSLALVESARFLAVCDVYAAQCLDRPHRLAIDPRTALADTLMMAESGQLDRAQADKLLRLTFYPAGSVVLLTDGSIALVVGSPKAMVNPAKATVIPLKDPAGHAATFPWPVDLADSNTLGIVRALSASERSESLGRSHPSLV